MLDWTRTFAALAIAAGLATQGCGSEAPPAEGTAAPPAAALAPAPAEPVAPAPVPAEPVTALATAERLVEERRRTVQTVRESLERAEAELDDAEARLERLRMPRPSDAEIFRTVQRALLEEPALGHVAIAAEVAQGVVVLRGVVPSAAAVTAAEQVARGVAGVVDVRSEVRIVE